MQWDKRKGQRRCRGTAVSPNVKEEERLNWLGALT
jgi:hypothetical protein